MVERLDVAEVRFNSPTSDLWVEHCSSMTLKICSMSSYMYDLLYSSIKKKYQLLSICIHNVVDEMNEVPTNAYIFSSFFFRYQKVKVIPLQEKLTL